MTDARKLRLCAALAVTALGMVVLAATASAEPILREPFHDEGTFVHEDFCGVPGLTVKDEFVVDGRVLAVAKGASGLAYFLEHIHETSVVTNVANGKYVTFVSKVVSKDLKVTDNGDGTLTILALSTGNDVIYGPDGKAIARNPGQVRIEILIDDAGTPVDPFDDEFIAELGQVKGSTGRNDDLCAAMVAAIS
jgi:hypothetical protein